MDAATHQQSLLIRNGSGPPLPPLALPDGKSFVVLEKFGDDLYLVVRESGKIPNPFRSRQEKLSVEVSQVLAQNFEANCLLPDPEGSLVIVFNPQTKFVVYWNTKTKHVLHWMHWPCYTGPHDLEETGSIPFLLRHDGSVWLGDGSYCPEGFFVQQVYGLLKSNKLLSLPPPVFFGWGKYTMPEIIFSDLEFNRLFVTWRGSSIVSGSEQNWLTLVYYDNDYTKAVYLKSDDNGKSKYSICKLANGFTAVYCRSTRKLSTYDQQLHRRYLASDTDGVLQHSKHLSYDLSACRFIATFEDRCRSIGWDSFRTINRFCCSCTGLAKFPVCWKVPDQLREPEQVQNSPLEPGESVEAFKSRSLSSAYLELLRQARSHNLQAFTCTSSSAPASTSQPAVEAKEALLPDVLALPPAPRSVSVCLICKKSLEENPYLDTFDLITRLPCGHMYHQACMGIWTFCNSRAHLPLAIRLRCPTCHLDLLDAPSASADASTSTESSASPKADSSDMMVAEQPPEQTKASTSEETESDCSICMDAEKDTMLVPCGHFLCGGCAPQFEKADCPICRQPVIMVCKAYR